MSNALNDAAGLAELLKSGTDDVVLTTAQAAILLGRSVAQLSADRAADRGPRWSKPFGSNGVVHYRLGDVRAFLNDAA